MLEIHNSFIVFMKTLTSTKFVRSELTVETLASPKYGKIIRPWPKQKRNMTALFWVDLWPLNGMKMTWYSACLLLLFLFRTNGKKGHLDKNDFRHCYGNFFWKWYSESYLITAMFKVPSQQIRDTLTTAFWKIPNSSSFYGHGSTCVLNLSSRLW